MLVLRSRREKLWGNETGWKWDEIGVEVMERWIRLVFLEKEIGESRGWSGDQTKKK